MAVAKKKLVKKSVKTAKPAARKAARPAPKAKAAPRKPVQKPVTKPAKKTAVKPAAKKKAFAKAKPAKIVRKLISSGSAWEPKLGYSRAVRVGNVIHVSGTTYGGASDVYGQAKGAIDTILSAVAPEGGRAEHVVRTRIYMTDISQWQEVARAHGAVFGEIRPATVIVEVSKLIDPSLHVEIEAELVLG